MVATCFSTRRPVHHRAGGTSPPLAPLKVTMYYDDIVIGSGLSALAVSMGLLSLPGRRVAVLCGPVVGSFRYYDASATVPCAYSGHGGLGSFWHGVIPTSLARSGDEGQDRAFTELFARFYPRAKLESQWGSPGLFVPWRAIRPAREFEKLQHSHRASLHLHQEDARTINFGERGVTVDFGSRKLQGARAWLAAGALGTPELLQPICPQARHETAADHAFCYVGQVQTATPSTPAWSRDGMFHSACYDRDVTALYTLRPAHFGFRQLDFGIEQRAVFGMPTGSAIAKIARRMSPGLLSEAVFNRLGLMAHSDLQSVYAQVRVTDAYALCEGERPLTPRVDKIRAATDKARSAQPWAKLNPSRRPEIFLPGIHLHRTINQTALHQAGIDLPDSPLKVVDASTVEDTGPNHHSFLMMVRAWQRGSSAALAP